MLQWRTPGDLGGGIKTRRFPDLEEEQINENRRTEKEHCRFSCAMESDSVLFLLLQAVDKLHDPDAIPESTGVESRFHIDHAVCHGIQILFHESVFLL